MGEKPRVEEPEGETEEGKMMLANLGRVELMSDEYLQQQEVYYRGLAEKAEERLRNVNSCKVIVDAEVKKRKDKEIRWRKKVDSKPFPGEKGN